MLRLANLCRVASLSNKLPVWRFLGNRRPFSAKQAAPEEEGRVNEEETEVVEEVAEVAEAAEEVEEEEEVEERRIRVTKKVYLNDKEALRAAMSDLEALIKSPNYGPFSFQKQIGEVTDDNLMRLQREAYDTQFPETKGKISQEIKNLKDPDYPEITNTCQEIEDMLNRGYIKGDFRLIHDNDFKSLIFIKSFLPYVRVFFRPEVLKENHNIFTEHELTQTLQKILKDRDYLPLLEFAKFVRPHKGDLSSASIASITHATEEFLQKMGASNDYNYLALIHQVFTSTRGAFLKSIDFNLFAEKLVHIYWGPSFSKSNRLRFQNHLSELLFVKLNIKENQALRFFMADMFLTAANFEQGLAILGTTMLILNSNSLRILNNSTEVSDLYYVFLKNFGQEKFNFYIDEKLPAIFSLAKKKKLANLCKQTVQAFKAAEIKSQGELKPVIIDFLDHNFYHKDSKILFSHLNNTALDYNLPFTYTMRRIVQKKVELDTEEVWKDALYNENLKYFVKLFEETCQHNVELRDTFAETCLQYVPKTEYIHNLSEKTTANFLNDLFKKIEVKYNSPAFKDRFTNAYASRDRVTKMITQSQQRGFSSFVGSKNRALAFSKLSYKPFQGFSADETEKPKSSSPFKDFLRKAEEVDKIVQQEQKISSEEVDNMKKVLFEQKKEKKEKKEKDDQGLQFSKITKPKATAQVEIQEVPTFLIAADYWDNILKDKTDPKEKLALVENHFLHLNDLSKAQHLIEDFIYKQPLANKGLQNHKVSFYQMFCQPSLKKLPTEELMKFGIETRPEQLTLEPSPKLKIEIETNFGIVQKDYNEYLSSNIFHYNIGEAGYRGLFESLKEDYKRRYFKKCLSHLARYSTDISIRNLELIAEICYEQKAGLTLIEAAELLMTSGIINTPQQLHVIVEKLKLFKDLSESCENLAKSYAQHTGVPFSIEFMGPYLDLLMKYGQNEKFMQLFEKVKDYLTSRRHKFDESLSSEENLKLQEKLKQENKLALAQLYREFIHRLNTFKFETLAKLLHQEQHEMKLALSPQDYINSIKIQKDSITQLEKILKTVEQSTDSDFLSQIFDAILDVISEKPQDLKSLLPRILDSFIYTQKVELTRDLGQKIALTMLKTADPAPMEKYLNFLISEGPLLKYSSKIHFLKLVNAADEVMIKSQLQGKVERLFSKEMQAKIREREETRRVQKASAKAEAKAAGVIAPTAEDAARKDTTLYEKVQEITEKQPEKTEEKAEQKPKKEKKAKKGKGKEAEAEAAGGATDAKGGKDQAKGDKEKTSSFMIAPTQHKPRKAKQKVPGMYGGNLARFHQAFEMINEAMIEAGEDK